MFDFQKNSMIATIPQYIVQPQKRKDFFIALKCAKIELRYLNIIHRRVKVLGEKDYYKQQITELVKKINNQEILKYLYIFIKGKTEGYIEDEEKQ